MQSFLKRYLLIIQLIYITQIKFGNREQSDFYDMMVFWNCLAALKCSLLLGNCGQLYSSSTLS